MGRVGPPSTDSPGGNSRGSSGVCCLSPEGPERGSPIAFCYLAVFAFHFLRMGGPGAPGNVRLVVRITFKVR